VSKPQYGKQYNPAMTKELLTRVLRHCGANRCLSCRIVSWMLCLRHCECLSASATIRSLQLYMRHYGAEELPYVSFKILHIHAWIQLQQLYNSSTCITRVRNPACLHRS